MIGNATKRCAGCGKEIDAINFSCPHCKTVQPAGTPSLVTRKPTTIAVSVAPGVSRRPTTIVFEGPVGMRSRLAVDVAVVTFSNDAKVVMPLSPVDKAGPIEIHPSGSTNGAAALEKTYEMLHENPDRIYRKSVSVVLSDGDFTSGGGGVMGIGADPAGAAIKRSKELQAKGTRVGTILFSGGEAARDTLKKVASSPSLFMEAGNGQLMRAMLSLTRTMTQAAGAASGSTESGTAVVFLLDASGSMKEGTKKAEAEAAYLSCIEDLRKM